MSPVKCLRTLIKDALETGLSDNLVISPSTSPVVEVNPNRIETVYVLSFLMNSGNRFV